MSRLTLVPESSLQHSIMAVITGSTPCAAGEKCNRNPGLPIGPWTIQGNILIASEFDHYQSCLVVTAAGK